MKIDAPTKRWTRNAADERAIANGCRFDEARGAHVIEFAQKYCRLYEGDRAGQPLVPLDWQIDVTMRLFGWVHQSEQWSRKVRRFTKASIFIPKKNGKSPTLAWWGLYLLIWDGEMGQKVFSAAKDGTQARISHQHAIEMVRQSDLLLSECAINKSTWQITHLPTRSTYTILSSDNSAAQKAKEGINGSIMIDEIHVVDRAFVKRISRAGISRSEPLQIEVSTAGNDPDGYGKERFDCGVEVEAGTATDERLFFASYAAPQQLSDEDLAADPIKFGKLANPAWGRLIGSEEYLADFEASKKTISDLADFKMYRLNIWQRSSNPWIRGGDWANNRRPFTAKDLLGKVCGGALDLGKVNDMSACSLVFPDNPDAWVEMAREIKEAAPDAKANDPEVTKRIMVLVEQPVKLLTFYWLPESSVDKFRGDAPYAQWVRDGWLRTTQGETVDSTAITEALREILDQYDCKMFAYDPWYAAPIVNVLTGQNVLPEKYTWKFPQTIQNYAWPTTLAERLIVAGNLHHDGNPITTWEMGHVQAKQDDNGNLRPVKPKHEDHKKIDGVVSAVMGLDAATRLAVNISVYESRGVLEL